MAAIESRSRVEAESNQAPYFVYAAEMGILDQARLAHRTSGSFQPQWYLHTSIYYPYDEIALDFHEEKGFLIFLKGAGKDGENVEVPHSDAVIAYDPSGSVHVVWSVIQESAFAFDSFTITPGNNKKNIQQNGIKQLEERNHSVIMQAARLVQEKWEKQPAA